MNNKPVVNCIHRNANLRQGGSVGLFLISRGTCRGLQNAHSVMTETLSLRANKLKYSRVVFAQLVVLTSTHCRF